MTQETAQIDPVAAAPPGALGQRQRGSAAEVLRVFLRLGLTSFGGPVAHLGYFRAEFVERRHWLDETAFADIVALCQFLPGPASSQVRISLGILRAGLPGATAAWLGFTTPSALAMILFGYGVTQAGDRSHAPWLHGLKIVAVLGQLAAARGRAVSLARRQCRSRRPIAGGALQAGLDERHLAPADFAIGIVAFLLLALWAVPPWLVVILGALGATAVAAIA
jgi:chromate transporter